MNDEVKHTPIPARIDARTSTLIVGANGRHIASTGGYSSNLPEDRDTYFDENDANAAFIVEAVNNYDRLREVNADLLEALEAIRDCITATEEGDGEEMRELARAAIARARGENVNA